MAPGEKGLHTGSRPPAGAPCTPLPPPFPPPRSSTSSSSSSQAAQLKVLFLWLRNVCPPPPSPQASYQCPLPAPVPPPALPPKAPLHRLLWETGACRSGLWRPVPGTMGKACGGGGGSLDGTWLRGGGGARRGDCPLPEAPTRPTRAGEDRAAAQGLGARSGRRVGGRARSEGRVREGGHPSSGGGSGRLPEQRRCHLGGASEQQRQP